MVNEQIIADLLDAQQLLNDGFVDADAKNQSDERVRPCKWAATALLARVYLYRNKWSDAIMQASAVINNKALFDTVSLNDVFLKNSKEAIWQLQSVDVNNLYRNTQDAKYFVLTDDGPSGFNHPVWASSYLLNAFEEGDLRRTNWIGDLTLDDITYSYFYKYKLNRPFEDPGEYLMVLRLAEQYLIRAEAMAEQGDFTGAKKDLNVIRHRAGLEDIDAATKGPLLAAILHERQIELFMEWGHRWFDLKRTGKMDALMEVVTPGKGGNWAPYKKVLPIPLNDLRLNHNLTQNEGYPSS
jgi:hypothetical protein